MCLYLVRRHMATVVVLSLTTALRRLASRHREALMVPAPSGELVHPFTLRSVLLGLGGAYVYLLDNKNIEFPVQEIAQASV
jgi:hypothetical protein